MSVFGQIGYAESLGDSPATLQDAIAGPTKIPVPEYRSLHFKFISRLDARHVQLLQKNAEAYYQAMVPTYFEHGFSQPLTVYYSVNEDETEVLFRRYGITDAVPYGMYVGRLRAVFTQDLMQDGTHMGLGTLFHELTHHFVTVNFGDPPSWFNEGLASFLGEYSRIVDGRLSGGHPNLRRAQALHNELDRGKPFGLRQLIEGNGEATDSEVNRARIMFHWLDANGKLREYIRLVRKQGYSFEVLLAAVGKTELDFEADLVRFFRERYSAPAYMKDGWDAYPDAEKRKQFMLKALEHQPAYHPALIDLAGYYYHHFAMDDCRRTLKLVLDDKMSPEYIAALLLMGNSYYYEKNYGEALSLYRQALEYSEYSEKRPELLYAIANCHFQLKDAGRAKAMYADFLKEDWEHEKHSEWVAFAKQYVYQEEQ